jgi:hypothetical protein
VKVWLVIIFMGAQSQELFEKSGWQPRESFSFAECIERKRFLYEHLEETNLAPDLHSAQCIIAKDGVEAVRKAIKAHAEG